MEDLCANWMLDAGYESRIIHIDEILYERNLTFCMCGERKRIIKKTESIFMR